MRSQIKRKPQRGHYDQDTIYSILDKNFIGHVGFMQNNQVFVIPMLFGRVSDRIYLHGSAASRLLNELSKGIDVCLTVTQVDGLVLARSAMHHSLNYRSVVIFGRATLVTDDKSKLIGLKAMTEQMLAGRWDDIRQPNDKELKATMVLALEIEEASAKIRTGPPIDDEEDYALPIWAGELPLKMTVGKPKADERLLDQIKLPQYLQSDDQKID